MSQPAVEVKDLHKEYNGVKAVRGVSFTVQAGTVFSLLGPNGAGKTTTVEILEGLREPTSGQATIFGIDPNRDGGKLKSRIGVLPQGFSVFEKLTVSEAIAYFVKLFGKTPPSRVGGKVGELVNIVGLQDRRKALGGKLSGGEKQRLGVAIALASDPEIIFLDEPTTGLDPAARREMWRVIENFRHSGKTVILTTHYLEEAEKLADRIAIMNQGLIIAEGSPQEIISKYGEGVMLRMRLKEKPDQPLDDIISKATIEGNTIILKLGSYQEAVRVLTTLEARKIVYDKLEIKPPTLEDTFLKLIGYGVDVGEIHG